MKSTPTDGAATEPLGYSVRELKGLGVGGPTKVYEEINSGKLRAKKFGARTIILAEDLKDYLDNLPDYEPTNDGTGAREAAVG